MLYSCLDLKFDVVHAAVNNRYAGVNDLRLTNLGPIASFSNYKLTNSSGKLLENISQTHIASLLCKLITSSKDADDFFFGFDRNRDRGREKLTNIKKIKGNYHIGLMFTDALSIAEKQEEAMHGLIVKLTLTRNSDDSVLNKDNAIINAKFEINGIERYVQHYTPSITQPATLSKQILSKVPTELQYVEGSVFMGKVNAQNLWTFELGTQEGINVPIRVNIGFQQREKQDSQNLNRDTFYRLPVTSAHYPVSTNLLNYDEDYYFQEHGQIQGVFRALMKDDNLQPYISEQDFRSANVNAAREATNDIGYTL